MPTLREFITTVKRIEHSPAGPLVEKTVAGALHAIAPGSGIFTSPGLAAPAGTVRVAVVPKNVEPSSLHKGLHGKKHWMMVRAAAGLELLTDSEHLLYALYTLVTEELAASDVASLRDGKIYVSAFPEVRPVFDIFLTQWGRTVGKFDREEHIRTMARMGNSHVEVNGLAYHVPFERGPQGELLHRFYTYAPALDQFVTSRLNKGFYDADYLQANLNYLKTNSALAEKYGLTPGIVCFEPRSVPDGLLERYPVLRGARVDHPMRSFHPRYNLSVAHPVVLEHYAEMMENLMREVPRLGFMSIWSNDSGAGFEYTSSLYVGRNGGGYLVREWLAAKDIAAAAAFNLVRFMTTLRDAGRRMNPKFRTLIRLEPFWEELDHIWKLLGDGLDVEVSSLLTRGWELSYKHPKYEEVPQIHGTALFNRFADTEKPVMQELAAKGSRADYYFVPEILGNHEPLMGIPFPRLVHEKLAAMAHVGVEAAAYQGGPTPPSFVPYNINQEVVRAFQLEPAMDLASFMRRKAEEWIGPAMRDDLVRLWEMSDEAFRCFPIPIWIYAGWGVWYRLFVRPIVPNIEAIPEKEREYYEDFLLATTHNRTRVDFRYDVGFDLIEPERAWSALKHMDDDLIPAMRKILAHAEQMEKKASGAAEKAVARDQRERMIALMCWYRTERNVTAWVAGVHGYMESKDPAFRSKCRATLKEMVLDEIANTKDLIRLWETATTRWMMVSDVGETTFVYYTNMGELMKRKVALMQGHENDEPYVDPDFQWRVPGFSRRPA
ncbi:MAG TPA: hypothetical protein VL221_09225 [Bacteroidota bacterium]|nr:hypothetical protein [Bacteroidota bacterium]